MRRRRKFSPEFKARVALGALSGDYLPNGLLPAGYWDQGQVVEAHSALGEGIGYEHLRPDFGNLSDLAWWDGPYAPMPRLYLLVRLDYQLFEVLLPVA